MGVYVATVALALSTGLMMGVKTGRPFRWAGYVAGLLVGGVVFGLVTTVWMEAAGAGSLFLIVATFTSVLVEAEARRDEPLFMVEPYWRRVILVLLPRSTKPDAPVD